MNISKQVRSVEENLVYVHLLCNHYVICALHLIMSVCTVII